jgi:hypothetical protein
MPRYSVKLRLHTPIFHSVHPQLKHQASTLYPHIQRKIQIVKLHTLRRCQAGKQAFRHSVEVRRQRTDVHEALTKGVRGGFGIAGNEVVFDNEGLAGAEVPRVVKGYRC